jgi:uncharacterized membrane protein
MSVVAHRAALAALVALAILLLAWALLPGGASPWWVVAVLPLAALLPGMLRRRRNAFLGASFLSLVYLFHALVALVTLPGARLLASGEAALSLGLLVAASFAARWTPPAR